MIMILKSIKKKIKSGVRSARSLNDDMRWAGEVKEYIKKSNEPVPELSEADIREINEFWKPYLSKVPTLWHKLFYAKTGTKRPDFVAKKVFNHNIRPQMNDSKLAGSWSDKAYLDYHVKGVRTPQCVVRNVSGRFLDENFRLISRDEAQEILNRYERLVIKPTMFTHTGMGVCLLQAPYDIGQIIKDYKKNYVIQLPVTQHPDMARLNASSVNTIRVNSVLFDTEAHVMSAFVKVGQTGEFADNSGKDRFFIGIDTETGCFRNYAINHDLQVFHELPSGFDFKGQKIPNFQKLCEDICRAHQCLPHFGFAFWDVCVGEDGETIVIEVNLRSPEPTIAQAAGEPFLGKYTKRILDYIKGRK